MPNNLLAHALAYAAKLPGTLLPVQDGGKKPAIAGWQNRATRDHGTLHDWLDGGGCNLGWQPDPGYFVLDIDTKADENGVTGGDTLEALIARFGEVPDTLKQGTPTGGEHWVFRLPEGVTAKNIVGSKAGFPGLDIRTKGGQIVVAPSARPEGTYRWLSWNPLEDDAPEIADAPPWLVSLACGELEPISGEAKRQASKVGSGGGIVEAGGRNAALVQEACALRRKGWGEEAMGPALLALNKGQFKPPLPQKEVLEVVRWACGKYAPTAGADIAEIQGAENWDTAIDNAGGDATEITDIVRKVQAAPGLSEIERSALFKRAAKAAGCAIGAIRAEAAKVSSIQPDAEELLPSFRLSAGDFSGAVDHGVKLLPKLALFQQGGRLVQVVPSFSGGARIEPIEPPHLSYLLSRAATWRRAGAEGMDTPTSPDREMVAAILARKYWPEVRPLAGIARQPLLQADGSLSPAGGYCPEAMHLMAFSSADFPTWAGSPPEALAMLLALLAEFPFVSDEDRAAAVAGMITGALRRSLATAPGFFVRAHSASSGKSYLSSLLAMFAGERAAPCAWGEGAAEQRKALLSLLLECPDALIFDNLERDLTSAHLARALTESTYRDRVLGQSKATEASAQVLFIANGNNCGPVADLCRRFLNIRLDPATEQPFSRSFKGDPIRQVEETRGRYVMAAIAIVQAWLAAGSPRKPLKSIASYGAWTDWVRQPLVWMGLPDPGARLLDNAAQGDPDRETLGRLLRLWAIVIGGEPVALRHVLRNIGGTYHLDDHHADLREALMEIAGERDEINPKRLGWWLKGREGRIVSGYKLVKHEGGERTSWQVVEV